MQPTYDPAVMQQLLAQQQAMYGMVPHQAMGGFPPGPGMAPPMGGPGQMPGQPPMGGRGGGQQDQQGQHGGQQGGPRGGGHQNGGQQSRNQGQGQDNSGPRSLGAINGPGAPEVQIGVGGPPRNNDIGDPSRVIHLRNVTPEVSQLSIQNLVSSFGRIRNIVMLRQKNQALVEMETLQSAQQMVDFFKDPGYSEIDGRRVYLRYSHHKELTASVHTSKTLLVSMFNTQYDVSAAAQITPMIVYQIFGSYGQVEKIVVLPKNDSSVQNHNRVQALVQLETKESAESVKNMLQGQPVTLGETVTFTLDIQFSRMEEIKTSSPHNSLVVPKGSTPQSLLQNPPPMGGVLGGDGSGEGAGNTTQGDGDGAEQNPASEGGNNEAAPAS